MRLERKIKMVHQKTLLTRNQAAKSSGISGKCFNYLIQEDPFKQYLVKDDKNHWFVDTEIIPQIKKYYSIHNASYHYYNSNPDYISAHHAAQMLNLTYRQMIDEIWRGKWEGKYVEVPKCAPPPFELLDIKKNYFFIRLKFLEGRYDTLEQIGKKTTLISLAALRDYKRKGLFPQPPHLIGTNLYEEKEILQLLPLLKLNQKEQFVENMGNSIQSAFDLLSKKQKQLITKYLTYRANGGVVDFNGYRSTINIANKDRSLESIKQTISSAFVLIISGRCQIEEDFHKNPLLKIKIPEAYTPEIFDIYSISKDDYFYLSNKRKGKTLIHYYNELRTFYYYLLDELEDDAIDDPEEFRKYCRIKRTILKFLKQFPRHESQLNKSDIKSRTKTFLTREQMVLIKQYILDDVRAKDPLKDATMWQLSCSTGVRPQEMHKLKISHFLLDSEGYIKLNKFGWGELDLPAYMTKQENSPSHPDFHTPIPADTVKQLNLYLARLYKRQEKSYPKGRGYLFKPDDTLPNQPYLSPIHFGFINRLRPRLKFLDDNKKQDFIFKASRHSLNNVIMRTYIKDNPSINEAKKTAADHQLRHKPVRSVGEEYYLDEITEEQFYHVLDATINFPWTIEKLLLWEEEKGYRVTTISTVSENVRQEEQDEESVRLQHQLIVLEKQLQRIQEKPNNITEQQWLVKRQILIKKKKIIINKLKGETNSNAK